MLLLIIVALFQVVFSASIGPTHEVSNGASEVEERIVGGKEAGRHSKPWMALIKMVDFRKQTLLCGGALISETWVLTAAHCFTTIHVNRTVHFGINNWCNGGDGPTTNTKMGERRRIKRIVYFPSFSLFNPTVEDIALLELQNPVKPVKGKISFAKLPSRKPEVGEILQVNGWGFTNETAKNYECKLRTVNVPVTDESMCKRVEPNLKAQFCAGLREGGKDSCQGDSGGPLVDTVAPELGVTVYGIVSFGDGCGKPMKPGVYTDVHHYVPWIEQTISQRKKKSR